MGGTYSQLDGFISPYIWTIGNVDRVGLELRGFHDSIDGEEPSLFITDTTVSSTKYLMLAWQDSQYQGNIFSYTFPRKSGTVALTDDLPQILDLR